MKPGERDVLLVVDVQNDFIPGGALPVKDGDQIIAVINRIARAFARVVFTQDWHTPGHLSFASSHPGKKPFDTIQLPYGTQVLWPDHCVQNTPGAALHKDLDVPHAELMSKAFEVAEHIAGHPPLAVRLTRESLNQGLNMPHLTDAALLDLYRFMALEGTEDKKVGVESREVVSRATKTLRGVTHRRS